MLGGALRILMVVPQPFFRPRGTPLSVLLRIRGLQRLGHRVDLYTYPFGSDPEVPELLIRRSRRPPLVRDVGIGPSVAKLLLDIPLFREAWSAVRSGSYDLIHTHEEAGFLGAWLSDRTGLPHVYDMHSSLPHQFHNFGRFDWRFVVAAFERLERYALERSAGVITVYPHLRDRVETLGFSGPLALLENTLELHHPNPPHHGRTEGLRKRLGLEAGPVAVYTGSLEPYQGMEVLLEAGRLLKETHPRVRIVSVGGTAAQTASLRERAEEAGAPELFRFVPAVPPGEVFHYHDLADVLVTCRARGTNTPLKIYQYLRSGKPIVATDIPAHTQVLSRAVSELVKPTPESVAEGIRRLLDHPEHASRLADAAGELQRRRYSEGAHMKQLNQFVEEVRSRWPTPLAQRAEQPG